jgi:hypothetical protein
MMRMDQRLGVIGLVLVAAIFSTTVHADGRNYNDGPVVEISSIRTVDGHFDDYMQWLATSWKKQEEAAKKAGLITKYQVLVAQPQGPNDPDIYLIVEYKNWAALDGLGGKFDAVSAQVEGSLEKATQSEIDRAKIRTVLGAKTVQVAELK